MIISNLDKVYEIWRNFIFFLSVYGIPFYLVVRLKDWRKSILFGTLVMWFALYAMAEIQAVDGGDSERAWVGVCMFLGWFYSLFYCLIVYGAKKLFIKLYGRTKKTER